MATFDIQAARDAGYSSGEIAEFLAAQRKFDLAGARSAGYSDDELLSFLADTTPPRGPLDKLDDVRRGMQEETNANLEASGVPVADKPETPGAVSRVGTWLNDARKSAQDQTTANLESGGSNVAPTTGSVMDGYAPDPKIEGMGAPVSDEQFNKVKATWEAATPEARRNMESLPGWRGSVAKTIAQQYAEMTPAAEPFDERVEARRLREIRAGAAPEVADNMAATRADGGSIKESDFDFDTRNEYRDANPVVRGAMKGVSAYEKGALGTLQAVAELTGADFAAEQFQRGAERAEGRIAAIGQGDAATRHFEGAVASIVQQLPGMLGGAVTGSTALALGTMGVQSFGQEYADGRAAGLEGADAAQRAGLFAAFEIIGERFGLGNSLSAIRGAMDGVPTGQLVEELGKALAKEIPGESLTTTGQFLTDKVPAFGLNQEAGWSEYLGQMSDTVIQTVMQGGMMMGGTAAVSAGVRALPQPDLTAGFQFDIDTTGAAVQALSPGNAQLTVPVPERTIPTDPLTAAFQRGQDLRAELESAPRLDPLTAATQGGQQLRAEIERTPQNGQPIETDAAPIDQAALLDEVRRATTPEPAPLDPETTLPPLSTGAGWGLQPDQATPIGATPVAMPRPATIEQPSTALDQMNELEATAAARRDAGDATGLTPFGGSNVEGRTTLLDWMTDAERERFHELRLSLPSSGQQQADARARLAARRGTVVSTSPKKGLAIIARNRAARAEPDAQFELEQRGETWAVVRRGAPSQAPAIETTAPVETMAAPTATAIEATAPVETAAAPEPTPAPAPDTTAAPTLRTNGAPFESARQAAASAKQRGLNLRPVKVDGGWGLVSPDQAPTPKPWELNQDDFVALARIEKNGNRWSARWNDQYLDAGGEEFNHPDLGRTVVNGGRFFGTRREVEIVARGAHKRAVRRALMNGEHVQPDVLAMYPDLTPEQTTAPDATHTDRNDGTVERATPEVIDDALDDSTLTNGRKWLLAKIQAAGGKTADAELVEEYNRLTAEAAEARRQAGLKKTKPGAAKVLENRANHIENNLLPDLRERIGFVTFKVPGDGTFKVLNTPADLAAFAKKVRAAPAFTQVDTRKTKAQTDPYEQHETRPDTTDAQRNAGRNALRDLQRRVSARLDRQGNSQDGAALSILGSNLYDGLALDGSVELTGQVVRSPADLAALAQVFRDPRFETFRVFYTDTAGKVVGEAAYTSRLPALVSLPGDIEARITADRGRFGATGYWVLHNHPSGSATPSEADIRLTRSVAKDAPGFLGHVVIDHNEYTAIDAKGRVNTIRAPELNGTDFHSTPELKHDLLGVTVNTPESAAKAAKALQIPGGHAGLIFTRRGGEVQLVMDVPAAALADHSPRGVKRMKAVVRAFARESGSGGLRFIVLPEGGDPVPFARWVTRGVFTDVVAADGTTAEVAGAVWTGDFMDRGANTRQVRESRITVDGIERPAENSEGRPIHPTEEGIRNFWRWFGDSKVVDGQGRPLVMYHGTSTDVDFNKFKVGKRGAWFTSNQEVASEYATDNDSQGHKYNPDTRRFEAVNTSSRVMPAYLKIESPYQLTNADRQRVNVANYAKAQRDLFAELDGFDGILWNDALSKEWVVLDAATQVKSATGNNGGFDPTDPRIVRQPAQSYGRDAPPDETFPRKVQRVFQDKFNRFTVIQDWLKERGITLTEQADVYRAEERMHGRTATRIEDFREKRVKPIIREIRRAGLKLADVADFLHAQHAEERNAQIARINSNMPDGGSGMTTADARAKLAQYGQNAELVRLANELRAITDESRDMLLKAGIITQEMADAWSQTYKHYVPLRGGPDTVRQGTGRGLTVKQQNKRALGHDTREEGEWIVENILQQHERAILQVEKNRVGQHLLKLALEAGHPDLITIDKPVRRQVLRDLKTYVVRYHGSVVESFHSLADAQRYVGQNGRTRADFAIETSHDLDVVLMPSPVLEETETQVYVDGHAVRVQFKDDGLARAWNNLGAEQMNVVFRIARTANMWMSKAYTGYNPEFITTNIIRDAVTGIANITGEEGALFAAKAAANYPRAFAQLMRYVWTGNPSNWIAQYRADGGTTGAAYLSDLERIGADAEAAFLNYAGTVEAYRSGGPRKAARVAGTAALRVAVGWIEKLNQAGENAMRLAVYRTAVESGKSRAHAASLAKNATVNFNRRGEMGSTLGAMYLFFNPAVQGTAALAHALFKGAHRHQAQAITAGLVTLGYHLAAGMGGGPEDEWEKLPEFQRERNIHIWTGDGWARLPIPYGYGWFMTLGRQLHELERGEDKSKVALRLASSFVSEFSVWGPAADDEGDEKNVMFLLPTLAQIAMAPVLNRTSLGGPIYPESPYDEGRPDNLKMWRATQGTVFADMAQGLNAVTGGSAVEKGWADVSPETLKFLWTTATGGAGKFFTDSAALARNLAEGVEVESREVPIVRKFVQPAGDIRATRALFWEAATEVREAMDLLRRAKRVEDITERRELAQTVLHEKKELLALGKAMDRYIKAAAAKRDVVQATMADESKPLAWRRAAVKGIEKEEAALYDAFLELYRGTTK